MKKEKVDLTATNLYLHHSFFVISNFYIKLMHMHVDHILHQRRDMAQAEQFMTINNNNNFSNKHQI